MKGILSTSLVLAAIGAGCASHERVYYSKPVTQPVVVQAPVVTTAPVYTTTPVITTPAPSTVVVVPAISEQQAREIAMAEASHHGWRNPGVQRAQYFNDRWLVDVYNEPQKHVIHYGWAEIAANGAVMSFSTRPRDHAYYDYLR